MHRLSIKVALAISILAGFTSNYLATWIAAEEWPRSFAIDALAPSEKN
jgi:hypothetical protein